MSRRTYLLAALATLPIAVFIAAPTPARATATHHHYASNLKGQYSSAAALGFDYQDVSSKSVMDALPAGVRGLFWLGNLDNVGCTSTLTNDQVVAKVQANIGDPKFSGIYYIADEPHTSGCTTAVEDVTARTNLIHQTDSSAKTFIVVLDGSNHPGEYRAFANAADYIGVDPYPCNVNNTTCDYTAMSNKIDSALLYINASRMVPVFQVFGQQCNSGSSHFYRMPSAAELQQMLSIWDNKVPPSVRVFDYTYTWGNQTTAAPTLTDADGVKLDCNGSVTPNLQEVVRTYFTNMG
jgi:hypothetical protein